MRLFLPVTVNPLLPEALHVAFDGSGHTTTPLNTTLVSAVPLKLIALGLEPLFNLIVMALPYVVMLSVVPVSVNVGTDTPLTALST